MTITSPEIILTFGDAELSSVSSSDTHTRADIDDLVTGDAARGLNYATYEPDKWLLDGSFHFATDPAHVGWVSQDISDGSGVLSSQPTLTLTLDAPSDINQGIQFVFSQISGDYPTEMEVTYKNSGGTPTGVVLFNPDNTTYFFEDEHLASTKFIDVRFDETSSPYRHARLLDIYVDGVLFDKNNIRKANTIEEINPVSTETPSNALDFTLFSADGDFSIVNPQGVYAGLKKNQIVDAYEFVDDARIYMGRFYLKDWDSEGETLASFICNDATFQTTKIANSVSGEFYYVLSGGSGLDVDAQKITDYLAFVFGPISFGYTVDAALAVEIMTGFIDVETSVRDTLQLIAHGAMSYISCARSKTVDLIVSLLAEDIVTWDYVFTVSDIGQNPIVKLKPLVTGIDLTLHSYPVDNNHADIQVYDGTVTNGVRLIKVPSDFFGDDSYVKTGSSTTDVTESGARFLELTTTAPGTLNVYFDTSRMHVLEIVSSREIGLPASTPDNILTIEKSTFVTPHNGDDVLDFNESYFQQRYICEFKLFASLVEVGNAVKVPVQGEIFSGIVERIESDLSGGFVQKVTAVGNIL